MQAFIHFLMKSQEVLFDRMSAVQSGGPGRLSSRTSLDVAASVRYIYIYIYFFFYSGNDLGTWKHSELKIFQMGDHFLFESL